MISSADHEGDCVKLKQNGSTSESLENPGLKFKYVPSFVCLKISKLGSFALPGSIFTIFTGTHERVVYEITFLPLLQSND